MIFRPNEKCKITLSKKTNFYLYFITYLFLFKCYFFYFFNVTINRDYKLCEKCIDFFEPLVVYGFCWEPLTVLIYFK